MSRRQAIGETLLTGGSSAALLMPTIVSPGSALAATETNAEGLVARLARKDPAVLKNRVFNIPPSAQVFPEFMRGSWTVSSRFAGYLFPSSKIKRERLVQNTGVPGFQKCSIAATSDIGKEGTVQYRMAIDPTTGLEDRDVALRTAIDAYLGYPAVKSVGYQAKQNPNRISTDFIDYKTVNAERIELFCNARESDLAEGTKTDAEGNPVTTFCASEYARQVTFGTGSTIGVPRQVGTNYAHFWTWQASTPSANARVTSLRGNLLTAAFLDPQDPLYFDEPSLPVAIYSHSLDAKRIE